jgi:hypothetical protein
LFGWAAAKETHIQPALIVTVVAFLERLGIYQAMNNQLVGKLMRLDPFLRLLR